MLVDLVLLVKVISGNPLKEEIYASVLYLLIFAAAFLLYLAFKKNRIKKNLIRYYSVTVAVMIISDILLYLYFVDNGSYVNRGMQGVWLSALPLVFLIVNLFVQTIYNYAKKPKELNI